MIFSDTYIITREVTCTALANNDIACDHTLTTINLDTETFAV